MNKDAELQKYLDMLAKMRRARVKGYAAPHKPVLLLTVQYLIETGWISDNRIIPDKMLEDTYEQFWRLKVDNGKSQAIRISDELVVNVDNVYPFNCQLANPFFFLGTDSFWTLVKSDHWESRTTYSLKQLRKYYQYAELDLPLFELMKDEFYCDKIRTFIEMLI